MPDNSGLISSLTHQIVGKTFQAVSRERALGKLQETGFLYLFLFSCRWLACFWLPFYTVRPGRLPC